MSDSGEGLVDTEARIQERIDERAQEKQLAGRGGRAASNPERLRLIESLRLARTELERQAAATEHAVRRQQIASALEELDRRLAEAEGA